VDGNNAKISLYSYGHLKPAKTLDLLVISLLLLLLFICAYNAWVISSPYPHLLPLPPTPLIPGRNYFALISNFVEEKV
jgi:hypothetical protein